MTPAEQMAARLDYAYPDHQLATEATAMILRLSAQVYSLSSELMQARQYVGERHTHYFTTFTTSPEAPQVNCARCELIKQIDDTLRNCGVKV